MAFSSCLKFYPFSISQAVTLTHQSFSLKLTPPSSSVSFASPHSAALSSPDVKLLDSLRSQPDDSAAVRLLDLASKQPNFSPESALYEEMLLRLGRSGSFDEIRKILEDMKNSGCEMGTPPFLILIESYAQFGLHDEILVAVHWMIDEFGLKPDTHFYNRMLNLLVDGNNLKLVEISHAEMSAWGIKPDVSTFNVLIKALCRTHQLRPVILMMEDMPSYGLVPDEKTFTTIMKGYIEGLFLFHRCRVLRCRVKMKKEETCGERGRGERGRGEERRERREEKDKNFGLIRFNSIFVLILG